MGICARPVGWLQPAARQSIRAKARTAVCRYRFMLVFLARLQADPGLIRPLPVGMIGSGRTRDQPRFHYIGAPQKGQDEGSKV